MISTLSKQHLRALFTQRRASLSLSRHQEGARRFAQYIDTLPEQAVVLSYISFQSELNSNYANQRILEKTKKLVLPQIMDSTSMLPLLISSLHDLSKIQHPCFTTSQPSYIEASQITHALIPGLAFDSLHFRLGYGKGYYDRWLAQNPHILSIGVGFHEQYIPRLPSESHDIALQQVIFF